MMTLTVFGKNYVRLADEYAHAFRRRFSVVDVIAKGRYHVFEGSRHLYSTDDKYALLVWLDANGLMMEKCSEAGHFGLGRWHAAKEIGLVATTMMGKSV